MIGFVFCDDSVTDMNDSIGVYGGLRVMRHHHDGTASFMQRMEQIHNLIPRVGIEVACWLIGQDEHWIVDESPGDCHTLLLAAGKFLGQMIDALSQPDHFQCFASALLPFCPGGFLEAAIYHREDDIMERGHACQ